ncbi:MAG: bifunctional lysylphosphatidylglycerol flippase/synthetase MprF [Candidatus Saccharimonadia bacterium]
MATSQLDRSTQAPQQWLVRAIALMTAALGLVAFIQPLSERLHGRIGLFFSPFDFDEVNRTAAVFIGFVLIYFSTKLLQRKIVAWWTVLIASCLVLLVNLVITRSAVAIFPPVLVVASLVATKTQFRVKSEGDSILNGVRLLILSILIALAYGIAGFWLLERRDFGQIFGLKEAVVHTIKEYLLIGNPDLVARTRQARWFLQSLDLLGAISVGFGIYSLFRPLAYRFATLPSEREEVERILNVYGDSPEDFFKLWPEDKSYYFSPNQSAFLAYRVASGVAVILNDPVGPKSEIKSLLDQFLDFCSANGWVCAFVDVAATALKELRHYSFRDLKIGEDAIVDVAHFELEVQHNKHFRNIKNRFEKESYKFEYIEPPYDRSLLSSLQQISDEWLKLPGREERGFALGFFNRKYISECPLFIVKSNSDKLIAFANAIPSYHSPIKTIDLMRHRADAPSNTMDFLFMKILEHSHSSNVEKFSLGLAPLSGIEAGEGRTPEEKLLGYLYRSGGRIFSFAGLRQFKNKFEPEWHEKFLLYNGGPQTLAQIALALSQVITQHS